MSGKLSHSQAVAERPMFILELAARWFSVWGLPGFEQQVTVRFSGRLHRAVGRCYASRRLITIAEWLKMMRPDLLEEALCHELAHQAAFELSGGTCRPHGPEWADLMRAAGFEARRSLVLDQTELPAVKKRARYTYIHTCPVCHRRWTARRPVRAWRCAACVASGLDGQLEIERLPEPERSR